MSMSGLGNAEWSVGGFAGFLCCSQGAAELSEQSHNCRRTDFSGWRPRPFDARHRSNQRLRPSVKVNRGTDLRKLSVKDSRHMDTPSCERVALLSPVVVPLINSNDRRAAAGKDRDFG